jgi:site-specific DNA-methyltransferase (adenine-specific)
MILCDLPYGVTACEWDSIIPLEPLWEQYKRIIKDNGAIVLTATQPFTSKLVVSNIKMFKYEWIWNKIQLTGSLNAKKQPMRQHETILVFYKNQCIYNRIFSNRPEKDQRPNWINHKKKEYEKNIYGKFTRGASSKDYDNTKINPKSIIVFNSGNGWQRANNLHPTQKPVKLFEYLILTYTNEGDTVLDNCMGSGTTAIACIRTQRHYIGMEKEKKYYDITNQRIEKEKEQLTLFD